MVYQELIKMVGNVVLVLVTCIVLVISALAWKAFLWVWWNPIELQRHLRQQGIRGPPYRLLYGNLKEIASATIAARSKPMELSHCIVPRVIPFIDQTVPQYGKISFTWYGPTPRVQIMDPDLVREVLSNKFGHFGKLKPPSLGKLLGEGGLVNHEGEKWAKHRRIINPAFHMEKLKMMIPAMYTSCSEMVSKWQKLIPGESGELDVWPQLQNLTAEVISRTAFGSSYKEGKRIFELQHEQADHLVKSFQSVTIHFPGFRFVPTKTNRRMKEIYREVQQGLRNIIEKREKAMKMGEANKDDLLGLLMESNSREIQENEKSNNLGMSTDDVIEECRLFYFVGQETTSTWLVWTMIVLSMHPDWQARAREEVLHVVGKLKPDFDGLNHLKIVTMILYEVLRLYPPVVLNVRATYKPMKLGEVSLPAGVQIALPTLLIHHDRELWGDDAQEFNPARFSEGISEATKDRVSFFPFGWGPRICIGQTFALIEAKMAMAMILQHFSFELSSTYVHAPYTVFTLQPQHGAQLILRKL